MLSNNLSAPKRIRQPVEADIQFNLLREKPRFKLYQITNAGQPIGFFLSRHFDDLFFVINEEKKAWDAFKMAA